MKGRKHRRKYQACFMAFDGDAQIEGHFDTIDEAWDYMCDSGSRWCFYPFGFVITENRTVVHAPEEDDWAIRRRLSTVSRVFREVSELPESQDLGVFDYADVLHHYVDMKGLSRYVSEQ